MTISLAFLAPELVRAAVEGRLPRGIGVETVARCAGRVEVASFEALGLNPQLVSPGSKTGRFLPSNGSQFFPHCRGGVGRWNPAAGKRNFWGAETGWLKSAL